MSRPAPIRSLTGMRFVAALAVVLYHNVLIAGAPRFVNTFMVRGDVAVPFFFVLWGFVLAYNYAPAGGTLERGRFWQARFARIYPTYLLALVVSLPLFARILLVEHRYPVVEAAWHGAVIAPLVVLMAQTWIPVNEIATSWNVPGWSLSVEAFFYAAFPFLVPPVAARGRRALWTIVVAMSVAAVLLRRVVAPALPAHGSAFGITGRLWWEGHPLFHLPAFVLGMAYARLFADASAGRAPLLARRGTGALLLAIAAAIALAPATLYGRVVLPLLPAAFGVAVYALAWERGPVARALATPRMLLLGEASYALYLLHSPLWAGLQLGWTRVLRLESGHLPDKPLAFDLAYVLLSVMASVLVFRHFEGRARRVVLDHLRRRAARRQQRVIEAAATEPGP